ncbi:MAG TPA: hypothetical protein VMZ69_06500 [Saprospiraceae bacterium]|nr:hypothetical protein [Saprospiraceae bacterium]
MKRTIILSMLIVSVSILMRNEALAQNPALTVVNVQQIKLKWPENGTAAERDSLVTIYNQNVVNKNEHVLSHREYTHFFTGSNLDYLVIEEYKDMAGMEASFLRTTELENKAWPDEKKRKEFLKAMNAYFENWHGDALYHLNPKLSKN